MKKIIFYIALAVSAIACDTQADAVLPGAEKAPKLSIITQNHLLETEGGTTTIKFLSTNDWTARIIADKSANNEDWCVLETTSGIGDETTPIELKVVANPNTTYDNRSATVHISSGNYNKSTTVTQKQLDNVKLSQNQYNVAATGEIINVDMLCNVVCTVGIENGVDWIKRIDNAGSENASRAYARVIFRFEVTPNTTGAERQAEIHFIYKNIDEKVTIIQAAESNQTEE